MNWPLGWFSLLSAMFVCEWGSRPLFENVKKKTAFWRRFPLAYTNFCKIGLKELNLFSLKLAVKMTKSLNVDNVLTKGPICTNTTELDLYALYCIPSGPLLIMIMAISKMAIFKM